MKFVCIYVCEWEGRGGEGDDRWRSRSMRTERKDYSQIQLQWLPEEPPWSEHFGRNRFLLLDLKRREVGDWLLVLELVFLVISMAYICLSVCLSSSTWDDVDVKNKTRKKSKKITGHRYIFYRPLSTLHTFCLLISYSVIHPFFSYFFFSSSPFSSTRNGQHVSSPAFSL